MPVAASSEENATGLDHGESIKLYGSVYSDGDNDKRSSTSKRYGEQLSSVIRIL